MVSRAHKQVKSRGYQFLTHGYSVGVFVSHRYHSISISALFCVLIASRPALRAWWKQVRPVKNQFRGFFLGNLSDRFIPWILHSQKRHRLAASCGFYRLDASLSTSCSKLVNFIKLQQDCENQTCCNLIFADLLQVVETTCIKLANIKSQLSNCSKPVDNLQQTCYHQAGASNANAS